MLLIFVKFYQQSLFQLLIISLSDSARALNNLPLPTACIFNNRTVYILWLLLFGIEASEGPVGFLPILAAYYWDLELSVG